MKKSIIATCFILATFAGASTIHTWSNGETLLPADLNAVFQHIHNNMVGGHGARLVNADVNASAAIASSKLAAYRYIPRGWVQLTAADGGASCGTAVAACNVTGSGGFTATGQSAGAYAVSLNYTATDSTYGITLGANQTAGGTAGSCHASSVTTTGFTVVCNNLATPSAQDMGFTAVVFDNN